MKVPIAIRRANLHDYEPATVFCSVYELVPRDACYTFPPNSIIGEYNTTREICECLLYNLSIRIKINYSNFPKNKTTSAY